MVEVVQALWSLRSWATSISGKNFAPRRHPPEYRRRRRRSRRHHASTSAPTRPPPCTKPGFTCVRAAEIVFLDTLGHEAFFTRACVPGGAKVTGDRRHRRRSRRRRQRPRPSRPSIVRQGSSEGADHRSPSTRSTSLDANPEKAPGSSSASRGVQSTSMGGGHRVRHGLREEADQPRRPRRMDLLRRRDVALRDEQKAQARASRSRHGHRGQARSRPRRRRFDPPRPERHPQGRRQLRGRQYLRQGPRHVRRPRDARSRKLAHPRRSNVLGLESTCPMPGDTFRLAADRDKAKGIAQYRKMKERGSFSSLPRPSARPRLEGLAEQIKQAGVKDLNVILWATCRAQSKSSPIRFRPHVHRKGPRQGPPLRRRRHHRIRHPVASASASRAVVIGSNVRPGTQGARPCRSGKGRMSACTPSSTSCRDEMTKRCHVYGLLDPLRQGKLCQAAPGVLQDLQDHRRPDRGLPCHRRPHPPRLRSVRVRWRDGEEVCEGKIASLKRALKDDVAEVRSGVECGIDLAGFKEIKCRRHHRNPSRPRSAGRRTPAPTCRSQEGPDGRAGQSQGYRSKTKSPPKPLRKPKATPPAPNLNLSPLHEGREQSRPSLQVRPLAFPAFLAVGDTHHRKRRRCTHNNPLGFRFT